VLTQALSFEKFTKAPTGPVKKKDWMTFDQLMGERRRLQQHDPNVTLADRDRERIKVQTVIQMKTAQAFSVLSFALIAIPLGIKVSRKETSANLGIGLALAMAYYVATFAVNFLDNRPDLRPDLLVWVPNIGLQVLGVIMFYKSDRS
jgi:lipopolysaccharide export system permease protein